VQVARRLVDPDEASPSRRRPLARLGLESVEHARSRSARDQRERATRPGRDQALVAQRLDAARRRQGRDPSCSSAVKNPVSPSSTART
jgi:hypothetical protein